MTTTLTETALGFDIDGSKLKFVGTQDEQPIETEISFQVYDEKHRHEKPYRLNYQPPDGLPRTNARSELTPVSIRNFRSLQTSHSFKRCGFTVAKLPSVLDPTDFDNASKVRQVFYAESRELLKTMFPDATRIEILEHQIRKRHPLFPVATGEAYEDLLPTTVVHIDFTRDSAIRTSRAAFGESIETCSRLVTLNMWKSLQGPGNDWPLALCDRRTIDHASDLVAQDIVDHNRYNENLRMYHNPRQQWYYFKDLADDEVVLFQQTDSDIEGGGGVPHTGFPNPEADEGAAPRVSIELRAFIFFE